MLSTNYKIVPGIQKKHSCLQRKHEQMNITLCDKGSNSYKGEGVATSTRKRSPKRGREMFDLVLKG